MNKIILVWLFTACLLNAQNVITGKIFDKGNTPIDQEIKNALKDEYGWNKATFEKRLKQGVYTETQINTKHKEIAKRVIKEKVKDKHEKIKPVPIEVVMIELNKIITQDIFVLTPATLRVFEADWKVIKRGLAKLSPQEIEVLRRKFFSVRTGSVATLLKTVDSKYIETATLFVLSLAKEADTSMFDDTELKRLLKVKDYKGIETLLAKYDIPIEIRSEVVKGLLPKVEPFFIDAVFEENAYLIERNWDREVVNGDVVIVNVSPIMEDVKYAEFIKRNKGRRYVIQLGLGAINNADNTKAEWKKGAGLFKEKFILGKSIDPELCIGITVVASPNWKEWIKTFDFPYDIIFLWNIYRETFVTEAVQKEFGSDIVIAGMNALRPHSPSKSSPPSLVKKVKDAGFKGVIWYNRHP